LADIYDSSPESGNISVQLALDAYSGEKSFKVVLQVCPPDLPLALVTTAGILYCYYMIVGMLQHFTTNENAAVAPGT
jgi:hypothetical protein